MAQTEPSERAALEMPTQTPIHKFGRGIAGVMTAWVEIPKQLEIAFHDASGLERVASSFKGLSKGFSLMGKRTGIGVYEAVTSPIPFPSEYRSAYEAMGMQDSAYKKD